MNRFCCLLLCLCFWPAHARSADLESRAVAFYYPWYGNPAIDGRFANWNHAVAVRGESPRSYPGDNDIGSNFYPSLGCYSVNDPSVLREHMRQLRQARIGVICVSWWGRDTFTDRALPAVFKAAEAAGVKVNFHIEPFPGRSAATTRDAIEYLTGKFGNSPACHRLAQFGNKPVFFIYDSYLTPAAQWATVLGRDGANTIRGAATDAVVIGLWVKKDDGRSLLQGGFDGFYTYFATDGFTYGSTTSHWRELAEWARAHDKLFVPCVAPGYIDTRIRPWNNVNTRDREQGAYYDRMWSAALAVSPALVGITSFNEWHEGTQIETAAPRQIPSFTYLDYQPLAPEYYLERTASWLRRMGEQAAEGSAPWLLAYFRQRYEGRVEIDADGKARQVPLPHPMKEERLHLALSDDGRHWEPLNGNKPVWDQWLRDPFLHRGPDGLWRLVATGGVRRPGASDTNRDPTCLYATSRDLVHWDDVRSLPLMQGVRNESGHPARNIWAPEWFLDQTTGETVLLWSSSFEDAGWKRSRLWFSRTRDWQTFTAARVLFAPSYSVIDGTLLERGGVYYLFHKEEEFGARTGERRAIRVATADRLEGPYQICEGPLNHGQIAPVITEGPSVMPDPVKPGWLLTYDYCMTNGYGISSSPDLNHWTIEKSASFPPDARHGSLARLNAAEAAALRSRFPGRSRSGIQ